MNIKKAKFLLSLIQDDDLPSQLEDKDIVDFEITEKNETIIIIRKYDEKEKTKKYLKYIIVRNDNKIGITKIDEEDYHCFYALSFASIAKVFLADLYINYKKIMTYEFSNDLLTCNNIDEIKVIAKKAFNDSRGRIIGVKK